MVYDETLHDDTCDGVDVDQTARDTMENTDSEERLKSKTVIASTADRNAYSVNCLAIDNLVKTKRFRYIVAWGKWLGFTPDAVQKSVREAEAENAPSDAIQKIGTRWLVLDDIVNETNRKMVVDLAVDTILPNVRLR